MVLGVSIAVAGALYAALGWINQVVGLATGMAIGFAMVAPAAAIALTVLVRTRNHGVADDKRRDRDDTQR